MSGHTPALSRSAGIARIDFELAEALGGRSVARAIFARLIRRDRALLRIAANVDARRPHSPPSHAWCAR